MAIFVILAENQGKIDIFRNFPLRQTILKIIGPNCTHIKTIIYELKFCKKNCGFISGKNFLLLGSEIWVGLKMPKQTHVPGTSEGNPLKSIRSKDMLF